MPAFFPFQASLWMTRHAWPAISQTPSDFTEAELCGSARSRRKVKLAFGASFRQWPRSPANSYRWEKDSGSESH